MDRYEAGKQKAEQFVRDVVETLKQDGTVDALLWWSGAAAEPGGVVDRAGDAPLVLRMHKGSSWRAVEFGTADIDASLEKPEVLKKYESEIAQSLMEL